ncbi:hybrid sensor histidine kinase/response regulator transcription factor [Desertivirga brevis]|uniref:hybrid sensor histidine kinase/response regulator transcription factor n=1 Tax=Desertivirga brevis TaxID=2810310 RepID=UPI001A9679EC|nr:two-component regulator propeller domain-containing protein [Pedobacter sp. SYSU D00873]
MSWSKRGYRRSIVELCAALFCFISTGFAQGLPSCSVTHFSTEDGLSDNRISTIVKDREGFMWFGTWTGLNRYDGHSFVSYKSSPGDSSALKNNRIDEIQEGYDGYFWLRANDQQIYRFNKRTGHFLAIADIIKESTKGQLAFKNIILSGKNSLWLTSLRHGAFHIQHANTSTPSYKRFPCAAINFLLEDEQKRVWIGTKKGLKLLVLDKGKYKATGGYPGLNNLSVNAIAESADRIYLGTEAGNLFVFDKRSAVLTNKKVSDYSINSLRVSTKNSAIFCATEGGEIVSVNPNDLSLQTFVFAETKPLHAIREDGSGCLWLSPDGFGVVRFDPANRRFSYYMQSTDADYLQNFRGFKFFEDKQGRVWTVMKGAGFGYYDKGSDQISYFYNNPNSATRQFSNSVTAVFYDPDGVMWLSTYDRGLHKVNFHEANFKMQVPVSNTPLRATNDVRSLLLDSKKRQWLGTKAGGLYVYYKSDKQNPVQDILINMPVGGLGQVYTIFEDSKKNIWFGTKGKGLYRATPLNSSLDRYHLTHFENSRRYGSLSSNIVYSITEDSDGRIWVGTYGNGINLVSVNGETVSFINADNLLKNYPIHHYHKVRHLTFDKFGRLWIGTVNGLIVTEPRGKRPEELKFTIYKKVPGDINSLGDNDVLFILIDSGNEVWVATTAGGLNKVIGKTATNLAFRNYSTRDGLPSNCITSLIEDHKGNLWLGTQNGLSKFDKKKSFKNYNSLDGLTKKSFSEATVSWTADDQLAFGMAGGVLTFNPAQIIGSKIRGQLALTNLQINNKDEEPGYGVLTQLLNYTGELKLEHDQNTVSLDYALLDYRKSGGESFQVRLRGLDDEWSNNGDRTRATYTNLSPGEYVFEVKSTRQDFYSNVPFKSLKIVVSPPFWRTWWAYLTYSCILIVIVGLIRRTELTMIALRQRIELEHRLTELKLQFFTNISHELRTPLTLIQNPVEEILKHEHLSEKGRGYARMVSRNVERMERFITQLLDLRKVQSGNSSLHLSRNAIVPFIEQVVAYFSEAFKEKNVRLKIACPGESVELLFDAEKIETVLYNIFANALKFAPADSQIDVEVVSEESLCRISIRDQGTGVKEKELGDIFKLYYEGESSGSKQLKGTGIGLSIAKEFIKLHGGNIYARNVEGRSGLVVVVELPTNLSENTILKDSIDSEIVVSPSRHSTTVEASISEASTKRTSILLVEDNSDVRLFLKEQLKELYDIETAENGLEGIEKASRFRPDLILTDVMMPEMDGIEMLNTLRNNAETSHIPIIVLTAKSSVESRIEALKYGADYYLTKPFNTEMLLAVIANLIRQRQRFFKLLAGDEQSEGSSDPRPVITAFDKAFLNNVIKFVEDGLHDPDFSVESMADSSNMSRSAFYRKLKGLTQKAPVEFIRDIRLKKAKELFDLGGQSVAEVAYKVGFDNTTYFSKCFKQFTGFAPSEYSKRKRS